MRFLNFLSELDETLINEIKILNEYIESTIMDTPFINESCIPLIRGGKRLRPVLFIICAKAKNNYSIEKILPLAAAIELIHTASLVHDDILDQSKMRRGKATANSKYGSQIAVLIGDYLFAKAFQLVSEGNYGDEVSLVLSKLVKNLCIGEITQDLSMFKIPTMTEYYERIYLKTAAFFASCCRLGGIVSKLEDKKIESLTMYGSSLGLAFQIIDDLLDFFGDPKVTGKALGGDLKSGVITLPVIRALNVSEKASLLNEIVTSGTLTDDKVIKSIDIIKDTDAAMYCKMRANAHINAAQISLMDLVDSSVNLILAKIADFVVDRTW